MIAGNVATGARAHVILLEAGADAIKVGIGPGSICTTRIVSGSGYPQLSAIMNCSTIADAYDVPIIADGGIKYWGILLRRLRPARQQLCWAAYWPGESPGIPFMKNGKKYKVIRGMASFGANLARPGKGKAEYVAEGVEALTPYKGVVAESIHQLIGGLCSGMSYCGVTSIEKLRGNGVFVEITAAGIRESHAHDVEQLVS